MIQAYNHKAIADRGAEMCGNDDFRVVRYKQCGYQYLHEAEVGFVYPDPKDMSKHFFMWKDEPHPSCSGCGKPDWSFEEIEDEERERVKRGP
jgi:hypothetical protein